MHIILWLPYLFNSGEDRERGKEGWRQRGRERECRENWEKRTTQHKGQSVTTGSAAQTKWGVSRQFLMGLTYCRQHFLPISSLLSRDSPSGNGQGKIITRKIFQAISYSGLSWVFTQWDAEQVETDEGVLVHPSARTELCRQSTEPFHTQLPWLTQVPPAPDILIPVPPRATQLTTIS